MTVPTPRYRQGTALDIGPAPRRYAARPDDAARDPLACPPPRVRNPTADVVPASFVDLLLTTTGPHHPSYVSRLLSELYAPEDHDLAACE